MGRGPFRVNVSSAIYHDKTIRLTFQGVTCVHGNPFCSRENKKPARFEAVAGLT
jgi:hypothetical protein